MRNITKAILFLLCIAFAVPASAELSEGNRAVMLERTQALTAVMAEAAGSEAYIKIYMGGSSEVRDVIRKIASADWSNCGGGTVYVLKEKALEAFVSASGVSLDQFSASLRQKVMQSVAGSIPTAAAAGTAGTSFVAAMSVRRSGAVFLADEAFPEYAVVFLRYNADYGVLCSFVKGEDNTVSASLVPADANCESRLKQVMSLSGFFVDPGRLYEEYQLSFPQK